MTIDGFRQEQKKLCKSGAPNKQGIYGCGCCRVIADLNHFKKFARKKAKTRFRRATKKEINENT